jgi:hypothetical protein
MFILKHTYTVYVFIKQNKYPTMNDVVKVLSFF